MGSKYVDELVITPWKESVSWLSKDTTPQLSFVTEWQLAVISQPYSLNIECRQVADRLRPLTSALWSSSSKNLYFTE